MLAVGGAAREREDRRLTIDALLRGSALEVREVLVHERDREVVLVDVVLLVRWRQDF